MVLSLSEGLFLLSGSWGSGEGLGQGTKPPDWDPQTDLVWLLGALDDSWRPTVPTGGAQGDVLTMSGCFPVAGLRCLSRVSGSLQGSLRMRPQLPCSHHGEGGALSSPF